MSESQGMNDGLLSAAVRRALRKHLRVLSGVSLALTAGLSVLPAHAELPVICVSGATCGNSNGIINNALQGVSGIGIAGNTMTVNQNAANAVLHWRSFNISNDATVNFVQPNSDSVALNRIYQNGASEIYGHLNANGRIYLINQNGILFGNGAAVNVAGLIASSLDLNSLALNADGVTNLVAPGLAQQAAFVEFRDGDGVALQSGDITVGQGATITTKDGGQVFMFAPNISNAGRISTPGGQTVLAAGNSVYLASSQDDNLRGIWVEVGTGGAVTNGVAGATRPQDLVGEIIAERGNITLAGAAVNQFGRLTATTSVNEGGSIRLVARDEGTAPPSGSDSVILTANRGGTLTLGANSVTEVRLETVEPDETPATTVDSNAQPISRVVGIGETITMEQGSSILATHGDVTLASCTACASITDVSLAKVHELAAEVSSASDASRIHLASGSLIDVSGASIVKSVESNVLRVELRGDELADSELQRDGGLRGETVFVDLRRSGTRADGSTWVGSPVGDLSGWVAGVEKNVQERSLTGGTINLISKGDIVLDRGATLDISGGWIDFTGGYINTSNVLGADGKIYDIADAVASRAYLGVTNSGSYTTFDRRWGVTRSYFAGGNQGHYEAGYIEGKDAGTVKIVSNRTELNATITARTETGRYQRGLSADLPEDSTALYRPYDELPLAGTLILGQTEAGGSEPDYAVGNVIITADTASQSPTDNTLLLGTDLFGEDKIGNLELRANGTVTVAQDANVVLTPGGTMDITAGAIDVAGSIVSHGGEIALTARPTVDGFQLGSGLVVASTATLDTSGTWVNDTATANGGTVGTSTLSVDGGTVVLTAQRNSLVLESGSVIDVSAGAQLDSSGELVSGSAGAITLTNTQSSDDEDAATAMSLNGEFRAYGFDTGGSLTLQTSGACIATSASSCGQFEEGSLLLTPSFFTAGGFGSYTVSSDRGGIEVAAGTNVTLRQQNWLAPIEGALSNFSTGTSVRDIVTIGQLEDIDRHAVDLTLNAMPRLASNAGYNQQSFSDAASLIVGTGARIEGDVGANITLNSSSRLLVDGTVSAAAGNIQLHLNAGLNFEPEADNLYFSDQGIWLGNNAQLLARGVAVTELDTQGRVIGDVLNGGTITLDADRGHVITSSGSLIDVSGTSASLSIKADERGRYQTREIGSTAGAIDIEASEAIAISGDLRGHSGDPGNLAGGTLRVALDTSLRADPGQGQETPHSALPTGDRTIEVTQQATEVSFGDGSLPEFMLGKAVVAADQVTEGGFDALKLDARTAWTAEGTQTVVRAGRIEFDGDVTLALARSLDMNAAIIASDGGSAVVQAPIVTLGNSEIDHNALTQYQAPTLAGTGSLRIEAGQIDVIGSSALQGFAATTLQSAGDLRLTGVLFDPPQGSTEPPSLVGSLSTAGDLTLSAAQVYPTTLSQFTVAAGVGGDTGTLSIKQNGAAGDALSAGGALTLKGPNVVQSGTVRAPFGTIEIESPNISLTANSVTSTSGAGLNVLFGETEGGLNWVYVLGSGQKIVYGDGNPLTAQLIELNGDNVELAEGATLDVRGGGNLIATEFVSGTTGTLDVLGQDNGAESFAIIPAGSLASAAYDRNIYSNADFTGGKSVYLSGTDDLPAGEYIVLPAKYALLPGAYLVTPVSGYRDITAGESYRRADGSEVISGYFTHTGTGGLRDNGRTSGFAIVEGKAAQNKAKYTLTNANDFFAASGESAATQRLPKDAGTVAITANESLTLEGTLRAGAADGGRGAALDIASAAIEVVADADTAGSTPGVLTLDAADLNALGAESLLLGGVRGGTEDGLGITTRSSTVTIADGADLAAPEVMLAATQTVTVEQNASVTARGAEVSSQDVSLTGDGAFVRVATGDAADVARTGAATAGRVIIADGAALTAASGSISLESSGDAQLSGVLSATGGEVSLTGGLISLGDVDPAVTGWVLDAAQLSQLDAATLSLNSRSSIDWYGNVDLAFTNINLSARAVRGFNAGTVAIGASGNVTFTGGAAASNPVDSVANGLMRITANNVIFDGGDVELSGFDTVALLANREVLANESTDLAVVGGGLQLGAQRITTRSGVDLSVSAEGAATLSNSGSTQALAAVNDLGGSFTLNASSIELATRIELPSGLVSLNSTDATAGGISLTGTAAIDTSGRATVFADKVAYSHGGQVSLETASGNLTLAEGSSVDVSATGGADAGSIELTAAGGNLQVAGTLNGSAQAGGASGSFSADAQHLGDFNALIQRLGTSNFTGDLSFRQRGAGDLTIASGTTLSGTSVAMTADQGSIAVAGNIVAHDTDGGRIDLSARNGMTISGRLDARATNNQERNGRISLNVTDGGLNVTNSAVLATVSANAASGTSGDGNVSIRLPQGSLLTVIDADAGNDAVRLGGDWSRTRTVSVEGFSRYVDADGVLDANEIAAVPGNAIYDGAAAFAAQTDAIGAALSNSTMPGMEVVTGIEIQSGATGGNLTLNNDWNMASWRFADATGALTKVGVLTLRAEGDLVLNQSLSDGFDDENTFRLDLDFGDSWSYNLIAGADMTSANVMATSSSTDVGSVLVNGGPDGYSTANFTVVRTGTGSIDVAAARDIRLSNDAAMIYTAGEASDGLLYPINAPGEPRGQGNQLRGLYYPANGGDVTLTAGRDIVGGTTDQLLTEWMWRIGKTEATLPTNPSRSTAWTVNFEEFHHGVGALGGGDVAVKAGNDVRDLSVVSASIGRQRANSANNRTAAFNDLEVIGGGNVSVSAGNDIVGGTYFAGRGEMNLRAEGAVRAATADEMITMPSNGLAPLLFLGDTRAEVRARKDVTLGGVATPTLLPQSFSQGSTGSTDSAFSTYTSASALQVVSTAGDVLLVPDTNAIAAAYDNTFDFDNAGFIYDGDQTRLAFSLLPGNVDVLALRGSADLTGTLIPNTNGALSLRAFQDVNFNVILSDVDLSAFPSQNNPLGNAFAGDPDSKLYAALMNWQGTVTELFNADTPVRMAAAEQGVLRTSSIVAATGDVTGSGYFGAPVDIHAGNDVVDLNVVIQNLTAANVSSITAGNDIYYTLSQAAGGLSPNDNEIVVDGPGQLMLTAGGDIDLATSRGVSTRGDEVNPALADEGASITALAGLNGEAPDYTGFATEYLQESDAYITPLMDYLETSTGTRPADAAAARAAFAALDSKQQRVFLYRVLMSEVRLSAEEAASLEKKDDYSRGFAALEALFPGSTDAENNPYNGDISLFFSRIYTRDGGDINLLTPGGGVNAGLAADTLRRFGIEKEPGDLGLVTRRGGDIGIVADGDVQVNESRIFAINDSDILVWSSNGDVDAGRGAKTAISAPTFSVTYDKDGHPFVTYDAALSGSGIQARTATADQKRGNVVLAAPRGVVNAGDAGIVAGNLTIAATAVIGADNISVTGVAVGVPVDTGGLGASLAGVASAASSASKSASASVEDSGSREQSNAPMAQAALSWLDVFVIGLGEESCKGDDLECLKRQSTTL